MRRSVLVLAALAVAGCATSAAFRAGEKAEHREEFDQAVLEYSKAVKDQPGNLTYRKVLERARLRAAEEHALAARRFEARGLHKEALDELRLANDLDPSFDRGKEIERVEALRRSGTLASSVEDVKTQARERAFPASPSGPKPPEPLGLSFRGTSLREAYQALGRCGRRQLRLRSPVPGPDDQPRPARRALRAGAARAGQRGPHLPPRGRLAHGATSSPTRPPSGASTSSRW